MAQGGKIRVGIVFGSQSAEHEISILSARNVLAAMDWSRFEAVLIGIDKAGRWLLQDAQKLLASADDPRLVGIEGGQPVNMASTFDPSPPRQASRVDVVFPVLHGTLGEDVTLQGLLACSNCGHITRYATRTWPCLRFGREPPGASVPSGRWTLSPDEG